MRPLCSQAQDHDPGGLVSPKISGLVLASPTRFLVISSSLAFVLSLNLFIMASRCSFHLVKATQSCEIEINGFTMHFALIFPGLTLGL